MNLATRMLNAIKLAFPDQDLMDSVVATFMPHTLYTREIIEGQVSVTQMSDHSTLILFRDSSPAIVADNPVDAVFALYNVWRRFPESHKWFKTHEDRLAVMFQQAEYAPGGLPAAMHDTVMEMLLEEVRA